MAKYVKWVGSALGWAMGGPVGAILGFALGSVFDSAEVEVYRGSDKFSKPTTTRENFSATLLILSAAVMKADGKVMKSELDYVKQFLIRQLGNQHILEQMDLLKKILKQDIPVRDVCEQIRHNMQHPARLQMLHYLFGIALADGKVDKNEVQILSEIAHHLGINERDFESIKAMFFKDTESDYRILEIESTATDEELKKAYRRMAVKYHPDKVSHMGEEFQTAAKEKFQKVQSAYENIKKERGI